MPRTARAEHGVGVVGSEAGTAEQSTRWIDAAGTLRSAAAGNRKVRTVKEIKELHSGIER